MASASEPSLASFAGITRRVIARDGLDGHLPTALYPARRQILVLEGIPPSGDLEVISLEWARSNAIGDEEFFVAFKVSPTQFKIVWWNGASLESEVFAA